jgi:hypothetical protein
VYVFLFYPIHATRPACFILLGCVFFISQSSATSSRGQLHIVVHPLTCAHPGESSANRELLVVQLSTVSCSFFPLRPSYSPQHPLFNYPPIASYSSNFSFARCSLACSRFQTWAGMRLTTSLSFTVSFALVRAVRDE